MNSRLLKLPPEIFHQILEHADPTDKETFLSLTLVNKMLNALATPYLYHAVELRTSSQGGCSLQHFLASILRYSKCAAMVRHFRVEFESALESQHKWALAISTMDTVAESAREWGEGNAYRLLWDNFVPYPMGARNSESQSNSGAEFIELLTALCLPRLNRLVFEGYLVEDMWDVLARIMDAARLGIDVRKPPTLIWPEVQSVCLVPTYPGTTATTIPVAVIISRMPWVKYFYAGCLGGGDEPEKAFAEIPPRSSDLESIVLQPRCKLNGKELEALLEAPKALRVFKYNIGFMRMPMAFKTPELQRSLHHHTKSLREISLTHNFDKMESEDHSRGYETPPMTFSAFAVLETLEISLALVFGRDKMGFSKRAAQGVSHWPALLAKEIASTETCLVHMLPSTIRTIRFAQCRDISGIKRLDLALLYLFTHERMAFRDLESIEVHGYNVLGEEWPSELRASFSRAAEVGIKMRVVRGGLLGIEDVHDGWLSDNGRWWHDGGEIEELGLDARPGPDFP